MLDTLSLGGGVLSLRADYNIDSFVDLGFCNEFTLAIDASYVMREKYFSDGNVIAKLPTIEGYAKAIIVEGSFSCESFDSPIFGLFTSIASSLTPRVSALQFVSDVISGPNYTVTLPAVVITFPAGIDFLVTNDWKNIKAKFKIAYSISMDSTPSISLG